MSKWKTLFQSVAADAEDRFDGLRQRLEQRLDRDPIIIQPYLGYGNQQVISLWGRVLQNNGARIPDERDTLWNNLLSTYRRFASDEIPYARVKVLFANQETTVTADEEGYFHITMNVDALPYQVETIYPIELRLLDFPGKWHGGEDVRATGAVIIPSADADYAVISDLDDTVLQSDVSSFIQLAKNTFLQNAHTRLPFPGVAAFYRALEKGMGKANNPIHYVSSSPWNLYDLLMDFFELKSIPVGPLFLQDIGLNKTQWVTREHFTHKLEAIAEIFTMYPHLPFVLIGDSTQHDADIYAQLANEHPGRVLAIYIRNVRVLPHRQLEIEKLTQELSVKGVPMLLVKDTTEAAIHAASLGLIAAEAVNDIRADSQEDKGSASKVERLVEIDTEGQP